MRIFHTGESRKQRELNALKQEVLSLYRLLKREPPKNPKTCDELFDPPIRLHEEWRTPVRR